MLQPVSVPTAGHVVLQSLRNYILAENLQTGDLLPPERELASMLNVSRCTVREVLKSLELLGIINRRPKRGTVLGSMGLRFFLELSQSLAPLQGNQFLELMEARKVIELAVLPLVIRKATDVNIKRMEAAQRLMVMEIRAGRLGVEHDIEFHKAFLAAAGNSYLAQFGEVVQEFLHQLSCKLEPRDIETQSYTLKQHDDLLACLRSRDLDGAREILAAQLSASELNGADCGSERENTLSYDSSTALLGGSPALSEQRPAVSSIPDTPFIRLPRLDIEADDCLS